MKKCFSIVAAVLLVHVNAGAQTIREAINHFFAQRYQSSKAMLEKMTAENPNNLQAVYWLGQVFIEMDEPAQARALYQKTLQSNGNAPLILAGMGHVELNDGKKDAARQLFETAANLSKGKNTEDPDVLSAISHANIESVKNGDVGYALEKSKLAVEKNPKHALAAYFMGMAYRKSGDGGSAKDYFQNAIKLDNSMAAAEYGIASLYKSQNNWTTAFPYLHNAIARDASFAPAYSDLYGYYEANRALDLKFDSLNYYAGKYVQHSDKGFRVAYIDVRTEYLKKNYDGAIEKGKALLNNPSIKAGAEIYNLVARCYADKGDSASARTWLDDYFAKEKREVLIAENKRAEGTDIMNLRVKFYTASGASCPEIYRVYEESSLMDATYFTDKMFYNGYRYFYGKGCVLETAKIRLLNYKYAKAPANSELYGSALGFNQAGDYKMADSLLQVYTAKEADSVMGYLWLARTNFRLDTSQTTEPFVGRMVGAYTKVLDLAGKTPDRFRAQGVEAASSLAGYYFYKKADKATAIGFLQKGLAIDTANADMKGFMTYLQKAPAPKQGPAPKTPAGGTKPPAGTKPTGTKPVAAKPKPAATKTGTKAVAKN